MNDSRTEHIVRNIRWGYICTFVSYAFGFFSRTILVWILGENYVGVNGLFTNVLGVLSFAELGIGTALNYSLYKPVAENDTEKIKSLMDLYRKAYRVIAVIILLMGLALLPFLDHLVKDPGEIGDIRVYYLIFLFNTVTSYFVSYKYSLVNARQENHVFSIVNMITIICTSTVQIVALLCSRDYLLYLIAGAIIDLLQKVGVSYYLNRKYPILKCRDVQRLEREETAAIWKNTKALVLHKVGDVSVHQTDNIIISAFVNIATVGKATYYTFFINAAHQMLVVALNSVVGSLGNAISTEKKELQYRIFKVYRFAAFWMYGYLSIGLYFMLSKLVVLLVGEKMLLPSLIVFLLVLDFYMIGQRCALNNMKMAGGVFSQDQYLSLIQAATNLVVSIVLVRIIGLPGVYIGTIVQGLLSTIVRPIIVYPEMFQLSPTKYFIDGIKYAGAVFAAGVLCQLVDMYFFQEMSFVYFIVELIVVSVIANGIFAILFGKTEEFKYLWNSIILKMLKK